MMHIDGPANPSSPSSTGQRARMAVTLGKASLAVEVEVTTGGLLAIGALVSSILLSSAMIVRAARKLFKR